MKEEFRCVIIGKVKRAVRQFWSYRRAYLVVGVPSFEFPVVFLFNLPHLKDWYDCLKADGLAGTHTASLPFFGCWLLSGTGRWSFVTMGIVQSHLRYIRIASNTDFYTGPKTDSTWRNLESKQAISLKRDTSTLKSIEKGRYNCASPAHCQSSQSNYYSFRPTKKVGDLSGVGLT